VRITLFDDEIEGLTVFDPLTGHTRQKLGRFTVFPSSHYVTPRATVLQAVEAIKEELRERIEFFQANQKLVECQRIEQRTRFDLEMLDQLGFCKGIENYSRHLSGRQAGEPPPTLYDYLPPDAIMFVDESHVTIPQVGGMYKGDRSRKENLVDYGFRLPSALDNRPLKFEEFEKLMPQTVFVSATPADYEEKHQGQVVEQVVRPTGLVDPVVEVRPASTQVDDLLPRQEAHRRRRARAGDDADQAPVRAADRVPGRQRHQGALPAFGHRHRGARRDHPRPAPGRVRRAGRHQPAARRSRHSRGVAGGDPRCRQGRLPAFDAFADPDHGPCRAPSERHGDPLCRQDHRLDQARTGRDRTRRGKQLAHNAEHGITPIGVKKRIKDIIDGVYDADTAVRELKAAQEQAKYEAMNEKQMAREIKRLEKAMHEHAKNLEFEEAAAARDELFRIKQLAFGGEAHDAPGDAA
jgi:excinuclease ABC subunit B